MNSPVRDQDFSGHTGLPYDIGVIGAGTWPQKFAGLLEEEGLRYAKAADVAAYEETKAATLGIPDDPDQFYQIDGEIPETFFEGLDAVQIASPLRYHASQALEVAEKSDLPFVVEKAYGPRADCYTAVMAELDDDAVTYPHLHYLWKEPSLAIDERIDEWVAEYGPIQDVTGVFVEEMDSVDLDRTWLFGTEHGGIVMDWIHPIEVLIGTTDAQIPDFAHGTAPQGYVTDDRLIKDYAFAPPTATRTAYTIDGDNYAPDATADITIGKGFPEGMTRKLFRFEFEDASIEVGYAGSQQERQTMRHGQIRMISANDAAPETVEQLSGSTPYTRMASQLRTVIEDGNAPALLDDASQMYEVVDMTNESLAGQDPAHDSEPLESLYEHVRSI